MHSKPGEGDLNELGGAQYYNAQALPGPLSGPGDRIGRNNHRPPCIIVVVNGAGGSGEALAVFGFAVDIYRHHVGPGVQILLAVRGIFVLIVLRETVKVFDAREREGSASLFDVRRPRRKAARGT